MLKYADGRFWLFKDAGDFGGCKFFDVPHDDDILVILLQLLERRFYGSKLKLGMEAIFQRGPVSGYFRLVKVLDVYGRFSGPVMVDDLVPGDLIEQAREGKPLMLVAGYVLPSAQENMVGDILGLLTMADLKIDKAIDLFVISIVKEAKSRGITPNGAINYGVFFAI